MTRRVSAGRPSYQEFSTGSEGDEKPLRKTKQRSPKKSKYFKGANDTDEASVSTIDSGSEVLSDDLGPIAEDISEGASHEAESTDDEPSTSHRAGRGKRKRPPSAEVGDRVKTPGKIVRKLNYQDVTATSQSKKKSTAETNGFGEVFVAKLPALPTGDVEYSPGSIHPNSLSFLASLRENNERDWFQARDLQYQAAKQDFDTFVLSLADTIRGVDDTIPELPIKDLTFRIYRDIRFSNDRTPYKTFLSAYLSRSGRKGPWAGYYFSLEPMGKTLLACGLWQPPPADLAVVRESIDTDIESWLEILDDPGFLEFFGGREGLFITEDKLKTCPKGFDKSHKNIDLLRLKSFTVSMKFSDDEVVQDGFLEILGAVIAQMQPFVSLLNGVIRPEPEGTSDSDS